MNTHRHCGPDKERGAAAGALPAPRCDDEVLLAHNAVGALEYFDLLQLVQAAAGTVRRQWERELRAQIPELSAPLAAVILQLGRSGSASQTRLARLLGLSQMAVSRQLDGLERRGWTQRLPVPADRRGWAVRLTNHGKRVLTGIQIARRAFSDRICAALDQERRSLLASALAALEIHARTVPRKENLQ